FLVAALVIAHHRVDQGARPVLSQCPGGGNGFVDDGVGSDVHVLQLIESSQQQRVNVSVLRLQRARKQLLEDSIELVVPAAGAKTQLLQQGKVLVVGAPGQQCGQRAALYQQLADDDCCAGPHVAVLVGGGLA